jgi:hypothetical protein
VAAAAALVVQGTSFLPVAAVLVAIAQIGKEKTQEAVQLPKAFSRSHCQRTMPLPSVEAELVERLMAAPADQVQLQAFQPYRRLAVAAAAVSTVRHTRRPPTAVQEVANPSTQAQAQVQPMKVSVEETTPAASSVAAAAALPL